MRPTDNTWSGSRTDPYSGPKIVLSEMTPIQRRQEIWRRRQVNTFYRSGRPIFLHQWKADSRSFI